MSCHPAMVAGIAIALLCYFPGCSEKPNVAENKAPVSSAQNGSQFPQRLTIDFSKNPLPPAILTATGLSNPETWGRWTDGDKVVLVFNRPLPQRLIVELTVFAAFGPNSNAPIALKIGESTYNFSVSKPNEVIAVPVSLSGVSNTVEIVPPNPASPKSMGISNDSRRLGLGLAKLEIVQP